MYVEIVVRSSALKHGLSEEDVLEAFLNPVIGAVIRKRDIGTEPQRFAMIGMCVQGGLAREIEIAYVRDWENRLIIFHANYLTKGFKNDIEKTRRRMQ